MPPIEYKAGSPFDSLLNVMCGVPIPNVGGTYEGTNNAQYEKGGSGEQKISVVVEQTGR